MVFLLQASVLWAADKTGGEGNPVSGQPSAWVAPVNFSRLTILNQARPGEDSRLLLFDRQVNAATNEIFYHFVRQVFTSAGVKNRSTISVDFDPAGETLAFHWIKIWRGPNALNRLDLAKIKIIQPERELDENLYNGTKEAVLFLDDVRPGDIIDYAFSSQGTNAVTAGKFTDTMSGAFGEAVERLSYRLLWPAQRRLYMKEHGAFPKSVPVRRGNLWEYKWEAKGVAALPAEDAVPGWYEAAPSLQCSEFKTWAEVNLRAMELFKYTNALSRELLQRVAEWKKIPGKTDQVLAALQFVQEDVRYLGLETVGSEYRPADPSEIYARRFGDCKDKALLLVTILRAMKIEAWPVLVNTKVRRSLDDWQPTMYAFNHAIAQVVIDGRTFWLDGTATFQRGPLALRSMRDYERGLVVRPGTVGLTAIPFDDEFSKTVVTEYINAGALGRPVELKVVTEAEGRDADRLRHLFASRPHEEIEKDYLNAYSHLYTQIKSSSPMIFKDDEQEDRFEITEFYTIDNFWERRQAGDSYYCDLYAESLSPLIARPEVTFRTMPLRIGFPRHEICRIKANFMFTGQNFTEDKKVEDPAFTFSRHLRVQETRLDLECEYRAQNDFVPVDNLRDYFQHVEEVRQLISHRLLPILNP